MVNQFLTRVPRQFNGEKQSFQQMVLGQLHPKEWSCTPSLHHTKINFKLTP